MDILGFNRDFTEFFIKNYTKLMEEEYVHTGFIAKCYNEL